MPRRPKPPEPKPQRRPVNTGSVSWSASRERWRARLPKQIGEASARESWHLTRDDAEAWIVQQRARSVESFDPSRSLGDYLAYWRGLHAHRWAPQTRLRYASEAKAYAELHGLPLERLRGDQVQAAQARLIERGRSKRYAGQATRLLRRALADAVKWRILVENAVDTVTLPTPEHHQTRAWDLGEVRDVLDAIGGHRFEAIYLLILWAGLRIGEAIALRWDEINDGLVTVAHAEQSHVPGRPIGTTKSDRVRQVDLPDMVAARLRTLRSASSNVYVAGRPDGGRWHVDQIRKDWVRLIAGLKVQPLRPHGGRRSFGTMHMVAGTALADLSVLLGHASPAVTAQSYVASHPSRRKEAAERLAALLTDVPPSLASSDHGNESDGDTVPGSKDRVRHSR